MLRFGNFHFDLEKRLIIHGDRSLELSPKALELLAVLVKNAGRVVSKDDLLDTIWPDTPVEEGNLSVHVCALRQAFEKFDRTAAYIETIPRRGYRFVAPISIREDVSSSENQNQVCDLPKIAEHNLQLQNTGAARRATAAYRACVAQDPANAKARIGLANTLLFRFVLGDLGKDEAVRHARKLLAEANTIGPDCALLHLSKSRLHCLSDWQWEEARAELQMAFEATRNDDTTPVLTAWHGFDLVTSGDFDKGLAELRRASDAAPLSSHIWRLSADACFLAGDLTAGVAISRKALQLHPGCALLYRALGRVLVALGEYANARRYFRRALVLNGGPQLGLLGEIAYLDALTGHRDRAASFLEQLQQKSRRQHISNVLLAEIYAALENKELALNCIQEAWRTRDLGASTLKYNSRLDTLRCTPQYRSVVSQIGI